MMKKTTEVLEPRLTEEQTRGRAIHSILNTKPDFSNLGRSQVLDQVKSFIPKMADAEVRLNSALRQGLADQLNVENIQDDEKFIEMDVALLREKDESWTSDSEADSTPSQSENDFTSDSDISSSSACSSSTCSSDSGSDRRSKPPPSNKKRPLVEDITEEQSSKMTRTQS